MRFTHPHRHGLTQSGKLAFVDALPYVGRSSMEIQHALCKLNS